MSGRLFRFKRFEVVQPASGFKITTDSVLIGAFANLPAPQNVLDIGTGTGVIALMLAQRFPDAQIHAVETDPLSCSLADTNFKNSLFSDRLQAFPGSFQDFLNEDDGKHYDLIVSNPPFFINSLRSEDARLATARHTDQVFFQELLGRASASLTKQGELWLILPLEGSGYIRELGPEKGLHVVRQISIKSFKESEPVRFISALSRIEAPLLTEEFVIYADDRSYTDEYQQLLREFLTIF